MGDRANVKWIDEDGGVIYFYAHWEGYRLQQLVAAGLQRAPDRWGDSAYLARNVFCAMVEGRGSDTTGFGISTFQIETGSPVVKVDTRTRTVTDYEGREMSFGDYVDRYAAEPSND